MISLYFMVAMMMVRRVIVLRCRPAGFLGRPWECLIWHHCCDALRLAYVSFVVACLLILIKYSEKDIVWHSCDENGIDCYINEIFLFSWFTSPPFHKKGNVSDPCKENNVPLFYKLCGVKLPLYFAKISSSIESTSGRLPIYKHWSVKSWESYISRFCDNVTEL